MTDDIRTLLTTLITKIDRLAERLDKPEQKARYTVNEASRLTGLSRWTIRDACNHGRVNAQRHGGPTKWEWRIPHEEVVRLMNDGTKPAVSP
jgi:hypothetical protein